MRFHAIADAPSADLAHALKVFEAEFRYPLGPGRTFRISHGEDYARFFRAIGEAVVFVAEDGGDVLGTLAVAIRRVTRPDGMPLCVAYLADLKILPRARGGLALRRLAQAAEAWARPRAEAAIAVVMEGTPVLPTRYTGRAGVPPFDEVGRVAVLRLPTSKGPPDPQSLADADAVAETYRLLSGGHFASPGGNPSERSERTPLPLRLLDGSACGTLEDTRRAKRLLADDGELVSAHLSHFAYRGVDSGALLLREALARAAGHGDPALFVAVPENDAPPLLVALGRTDATVAPAVVYAHGLEKGSSWYINTAEI